MDTTGKMGATYEAKILLPLETFAYGVPPHTFIDYFHQMSKGLNARCCDVFDLSMKLLYDEKYLRTSDALDFKRIAKLHKEGHGVNGMPFGSLDCRRTPCKNCPKGWQASFNSRKETCGPTVVLEALSDYHLWFWHASFGYAGSLNDLNILNLSPLLVTLLDGTFTELEQSSMLVPFEVAGNLFNCLFVLVDGIYPHTRDSSKASNYH
jgi:hypothetical protein